MEKTGNSATLWTIGHSSADTAKLFDLLRRHHIEVLVDVRASPYSSYVPHSNREVLEAAAAAAGLSYVFMGDSLGGKPKDSNLCDSNGKPDYARIAGASEYVKGIDRLVELAHTRRVCIMCSEEDPARCHRGSLIAPTLGRRGLCVVHVRHGDPDESQEAMELRKTGGQLTLF